MIKMTKQRDGIIDNCCCNVTSTEVWSAKQYCNDYNKAFETPLNFGEVRKRGTVRKREEAKEYGNGIGKIRF